MAGTASVWPKDGIERRFPSYPVLEDITADMRLLVDDIEVLRSGLAAAEDWILEVNIDLETRLTGSKAAYDTASAADGVQINIADTTITGAALGDFAQISLGIDIDDFISTAYVSATSTVAGLLVNESTGTIDLAATTVRYLVTPFAASALEGTITAAVLSATAFNAASDMTAYNITIS